MAICRGERAQAIVEAIYTGIDIGDLSGGLPAVELARPVCSAALTHKYDIGIRVIFADQRDGFAN